MLKILFHIFSLVTISFVIVTGGRAEPFTVDPIDNLFPRFPVIIHDRYVTYFSVHKSCVRVELQADSYELSFSLPPHKLFVVAALCMLPLLPMLLFPVKGINILYGRTLLLPVACLNC